MGDGGQKLDSSQQSGCQNLTQLKPVHQIMSLIIASGILRAVEGLVQMSANKLLTCCRYLILFEHCGKFIAGCLGLSESN